MGALDIIESINFPLFNEFRFYYSYLKNLIFKVKFNLFLSHKNIDYLMRTIFQYSKHFLSVQIPTKFDSDFEADD